MQTYSGIKKSSPPVGEEDNLFWEFPKGSFQGSFIGLDMDKDKVV
jgi:hypothetical protein